MLSVIKEKVRPWDTQRSRQAWVSATAVYGDELKAWCRPENTDHTFSHDIGYKGDDPSMR